MAIDRLCVETNMWQLVLKLRLNGMSVRYRCAIIDNGRNRLAALQGSRLDVIVSNCVFARLEAVVIIAHEGCRGCQAWELASLPRHDI